MRESGRIWMRRCPVLAFGSHLWDIEKPLVCATVDSAYRKGIRRGLGRKTLSETDFRIGFQKHQRKCACVKTHF